MRLINVKTSRLEVFPDDKIPHYAILSHTWGSDVEELTLRDVEQGEIDKPGVGSVKFRGCCQQAREDGLEYIWIDTCCINKTDLVELSEAINSMFRWYRRASVCYAYLSDVPGDQNLRKGGSKFRTSRWFRRGWTLQELLAPKRLVFYSTEWRYLGTKGRLSTVIEGITGIPHLFLKGINDLQSASVAQRMSWAAQRETKRKEDLAYCLLGIFGIAMPMIYGEGGYRAFFRLQEQIIRSTRDHSILAWGLGGESPGGSAQPQARGFLAAAPSDFTNSGHIVPRNQFAAYLDSLEISGGSLRVSLSLLATSAETIGLLNCGPEEDTDQVVGIPLMRVASGGVDEYIRPRGCHSVLRPITESDASRKHIHVKNDNGPDTKVSDQQGWVYDDADFDNVHLELVDVAPQSSWDADRAVIMSTTEPEGSAAHPTLVRLRHAEDGSRDFILILEFRQQGTHVEAHHCIAICSRNTPLMELVGKLQYITRQVSGKTRASNGLLNLQLILERNARRPMFTMRPKAMLYPPYFTIDVTVELRKPRLTLEIEGMLHAQKRWDELQHIDYCEKSGELESICGQPPLLWASANGHTEMVKLLLDGGIDVAAANNGKRTPLIAASENGHADVVRLLLVSSGTDIDLKDSESGRAPLSWAAERGHETVVQLLLEKGADLNIEDKTTRTALSYAARGGHEAIVQLLRNYATIIDDNTMLGLRQLEGHTASVNSVAFSPDSKLLASASRDKTVRLWDAATGQLQQTLKGHTAYVNSVAFSPDWKLLASASRDKNVRLWDAATGQLQQTLKAHIDYVNSVAFSPDSKLLASASHDKTVRLWDAATGQLQQTLEGHIDYVNSVAFSPDSKLLASASHDKTVWLWYAATGA